MGDNTDDFSDLLGTLYRPSGGVRDELSMLRSGFEAQLRSIEANTEAIENAAARLPTTDNAARGGTWDSVAPILKPFLSGMPLVSGLISLFSGGGDPETPAPITKYSLPAAVQVNAGLFQGGRVMDAIDYSQGGNARMAGASLLPNPSAPTVVVQVQAMDSQSFLDRSDDIADAVRKALLNSHPLGDVLS
ncbi:MAG: hypothetical protein NTY38_13325 [Acidobacteria bacterium]|nr:hypothetical protein [Acidobacteriota bacterium]